MQRYFCFQLSPVVVTVGLGLIAGLPAAASISFTCDSTIDATQAGTCAYLNSNIGGSTGIYAAIFSNANASIYIQETGGGLGSSTVGFFNTVSYSTYLADLTAHSSGDAVDVAALAALNAVDTPIYGSNSVVITSALGLALGISPSSLNGTTSGGVACFIGTAGCYNGIITIAAPGSLPAGQSFYWNQNGGTQPGTAYDFYSVVEHETDEILGTSSCVDTGGTLSNPCATDFGAGTPSAADLFRYSATGSLINLHNALSTTPGQYFSYNGGATNGANGRAYNTLANGEDYADFSTNCLDVQDATGCLGLDLNINTDGNAEINILDAVGYNLNQDTAPEPGTISLFVVGVAAMVAYRRRGRA